MLLSRHPGQVQKGLYLGQVATRCVFTNAQAPTMRQAMSLRGHIARDNIGSLQIILANSFIETAFGGNTTVTASIEYPIGVTLTQIKFGGSASGTLVDGQLLVSDACAVSIPNGAKFATRVWRNNAVGMGAFGGWSDFTNFGDVLNQSTTTTADLTMSTTVPSDNGGGNNYGPCAIIAQTRKPSMYINGDSRSVGANDQTDVSGDMGNMARSIGPKFGYICVGVSGTTAASFNAAHTLRMQLAQYCSHIIQGYGINDLAASGTATCQTGFQTLWASYGAAQAALRLPPQQIFQCTVEPDTTSTDSFITAANQTEVALAGSLANFNAWIKSRPLGIDGVCDINQPVEDPAVPKKWRSDGVTANLYSSGSPGVHERPYAYLEIQKSGVINPLAMRR